MVDIKIIAEVCPPGCYHRLKMALLLSLVSSEAGQQEEGPGNVVILKHYMICI